MRTFKRLAPIVLLAALSAACGDTARTPAASPTTPAPTATTTPAPRTEQWVLFERKEADKYYEVETLGFFRRRLSDGKEERIPLSAAERSWYVSPDGRQVAVVERLDAGSRLLVAPADNVVVMREIVKTRGLASVVWSADGKSIFYTTAVPGDDHEPPDTGVETLNVVDADGSNARRITTWDYFGSYAYRDLLTHDAKNKRVLWTRGTHEGSGGSDDVWETSISTGATRNVAPFDTTLSGTHAITPDGRFLYYVKGHDKLMELSTSDGKERVMYAADDPNQPAIEQVHVTPDGARLVFRTTGRAIIGAQAKKDPIATTYVILLDGGTRSSAFTDEEATFNVSPSPDVEYLWLIDGNHTRERTELLEVSTGRRTVIAGTSKIARLIAWLNVSAER